METRQALVRELIPNELGSSFIYKQEPSVWPVWHSHEEIDILLFLVSSGQHVTGDYIGDFRPGTLIVNGPNVPHGHTTRHRVKTQADIVVIQFSEQTIGKEFLAKPEMAHIREWLESTKRSFEYLGQTRTEAMSLILAMNETEGIQRFTQFLQLLELFAHAPESDRKVLVSEFYAPVLNDENIHRIEQVRAWVLANLSQKITLARAASQIHMSAKSFSNFFKKNTGKAFVQYVKELRIGLASQKLLESEHSVSEICFACGYNNLSNFNRQFMDAKKTTPTAYRKQFQDLITRDAPTES